MHCAQLPVLDARTPDEILGYEDGILFGGHPSETEPIPRKK
jgi:hypothetical protein